MRILRLQIKKIFWGGSLPP